MSLLEGFGIPVTKFDERGDDSDNNEEVDKKYNAKDELVCDEAQITVEDDL